MATTVRERNKQRTRRDIRDAALGIFDDAGFSACSVEGVARRVGCSKATIYTYFPGGLNDIFQEIYVELSDEMILDGGQRRAGLQEPVERIMALAEVLLDISTRPRAGRFFALSNPSLNPVLLPVLGGGSKQYESLIAQDLEDAPPAHEGARSCIATLATLIVGAFREAAIKVAEDPSRRDEMRAGMRVLIESVAKGPVTT